MAILRHFGHHYVRNLLSRILSARPFAGEQTASPSNKVGEAPAAAEIGLQPAAFCEGGILSMAGGRKEAS